MISTCACVRTCVTHTHTHTHTHTQSLAPYGTGRPSKRREGRHSYTIFPVLPATLRRIIRSNGAPPSVHFVYCTHLSEEAVSASLLSSQMKEANQPEASKSYSFTSKVPLGQIRLCRKVRVESSALKQQESGMLNR